MEDAQLVRALRDGDEDTFRRLIDEYSPSLLRVAMAYVDSRATAEEVLQDTWVGVLKGLDGFEGRSSLRTWIFKILTNTAKTRGARERRTMPFSSLMNGDETPEGGTVDPDRFFPPDHDRYPGHWAFGPRAWDMPDQELLSGEVRDVILTAIEQLPRKQRIVVTLRDIEGWPAHEVCEAIDVTVGNQRVLLHRARSEVRSAVERYLDAVEQTVSVAGSAVA